MIYKWVDCAVLQSVICLNKGNASQRHARCMELLYLFPSRGLIQFCLPKPDCFDLSRLLEKFKIRKLQSAVLKIVI